jgi:5-formyltetrahydrofolate cyclo-ligase
MDTKSELRAHYNARRDGFAETERAEASRAICAHLGRLCRHNHFTRIGAFWPFGSEVDLRAAVTVHADRLWFFPRIISTHPPRLAWGTEPLEKGPWGLMEPSLAQHFLPPVQLLLVPGLAFDDDGHRLGYGRGFFDALLTRLPEDVLTVGVGFELQMHQSLIIEPHDWPVRGLLSERGLRLLKPQQ